MQEQEKNQTPNNPNAQNRENGGEAQNGQNPKNDRRNNNRRRNGNKHDRNGDRRNNDRRNREQEERQKESEQPVLPEEEEIRVPDPDYDESEDVATAEDMEAYAREVAEKRAQKAKGVRTEQLEEQPKEEGSNSEMTDIYLEPDPTLPWVKYDDNLFLSRGCNQCPKPYEPIKEQELRSCCKVGACNWMKGIRQPCEPHPFDCVEVRFKNNRKEFYRLPEGIDVNEGDLVAVEGVPGHDVGIVSLKGEACRIQMERKRVDHSSDSIKKLFRRAKASDIDRWVEALEEERDAVVRTRRISESLGLVMKVNDVEFQGDRGKAIFYYTADERVDFRALIKVLADEFHVRVEMKQIGVRQEAGKVGGIGTCGRELCCSTWLTNFKSVTTSVAKAQQILPNPQKLAGQCGKLKCCLNFEYEVYVDALKHFPPANTPIRFQKGLALYKKTDVLGGVMWYAYEGENDLYAISAEDVKKIIEMNRNQEYPEKLEDFKVELMSASALTQESNDADFERELKMMADTNEDNGTKGEERKGDRRGDRGERGDRKGRNENRGNRGPREKGERNDRGERSERGERGERNDRGERGDRNNRRNGDNHRGDNHRQNENRSDRTPQGEDRRNNNRNHRNRQQ